MAKDCVKLERLFQEVADHPEDELLTYVDAMGFAYQMLRRRRVIVT